MLVYPPTPPEETVQAKQPSEAGIPAEEVIIREEEMVDDAYAGGFEGDLEMGVEED